MNMDVFNDPEMMEIFEGFIIESNEILENLSQDLMKLEENSDDNELLNKIFRAYHTIKGNSSFIGLDDISALTHHAEDLLNKLRRGEMQVKPEIVDTLFEVQDSIENYLEYLKEGEAPESDFSSIIAKIDKIKAEGLGEESAADPDENAGDPRKEDQAEEALEETAESSENDPLNTVFSKSDMFEGDCDFADDELELINAAFSEINKSFKSQSAGSDHAAENGNEAAVEVEDKPEQASPVNGKGKPEQKNTRKKSLKSITSETIRIDLNRIDNLMDLCGELVLGRNRLSQISNQYQSESEMNISLRDLLETAEQIDFITTEIQASVMRMRMVPISKLFQKAPRIVRDLAREFGKKINLTMKGEDTEIDRGIIEELTDPLVHMIRNSCDHGVESPDMRAEAGKSEQGNIVLDAEQEGNHIVISISDDGKGLDAKKLQAKAIEKNVITAEQAKQLSLRETYQLIFAPGFSTAENLSKVSGRGVGMDVVKTNIQNLKGMVEVESELGKGTKFIIKLPLTLASILGLLVKAGDETIAIPLSSVVEVVALERKNLSNVNQKEMIKIRDEIFPLVRLEDKLHFIHRNQNLSDSKKYVVLVGVGIKRVGIVVDELKGQQEIVIKSLGEYLGTVRGIAGSTILGDGRVIIILDINELLNE